MLLLLAALCWSLGGVLLKSVNWPPLAVGGGRGLVAAVFLLLVVGHRKPFRWGWLPLVTAVAYTACTLLFAAATKLTTAANAILIQYTAPAYVALLGAWLLKERPTRYDWLTIAVVFVGLAIFLYDGLRLNDVAGILLAIGSGVAFSVMIVLLRLQKDGSPIGSIILGNFFAFLCGLPSILGAPLPDTQSWIALLLLGVVQLGVAYLIYTKAIKHVTALEAVLIPVIEPILNPIWVMLVLGEKPSALALFGGAIVIGAVTWRAVYSIRQPPPAVLPG
ncbi:MAG: DMT family transporter [Opitutae bacterium]|nr:DMT family transporter [Opitutae bacterium]